MKTIFSNKTQKAEKSKLKDSRQGALLPTSELQLRTAMACISNILRQQISLSTAEERIFFFSQVINTAFNLSSISFTSKGKKSPHQSPEAIKGTQASHEILCVACSVMECLAFNRNVVSNT